MYRKRRSLFNEAFPPPLFVPLSPFPTERVVESSLPSERFSAYLAPDRGYMAAAPLDVTGTSRVDGRLGGESSGSGGLSLPGPSSYNGGSGGGGGPSEATICHRQFAALMRRQARGRGRGGGPISVPPWERWRDRTPL